MYLSFSEFGKNGVWCSISGQILLIFLWCFINASAVINMPVLNVWFFNHFTPIKLIKPLRCKWLLRMKDNIQKETEKTLLKRKANKKNSKRQKIAIDAFIVNSKARSWKRVYMHFQEVLIHFYAVNVYKYVSRHLFDILYTICI